MKINRLWWILISFLRRESGCWQQKLINVSTVFVFHLLHHTHPLKLTQHHHFNHFLWKNETEKSEESKNSLAYQLVKNVTHFFLQFFGSFVLHYISTSLSGLSDILGVSQHTIGRGPEGRDQLWNISLSFPSLNISFVQFLISQNTRWPPYWPVHYTRVL